MYSSAYAQQYAGRVTYRERGIGTSMAVGGALGVASTIATCYANGMNPLTGKTLTYNSNHSRTDTNYNGRVVTNPDGSQVTINIPSDYSVRPADNSNGVIYQAQDAAGNTNMIRIMGPTDYAPNGYIVFYNNYGQPYNPTNGMTLPKTNWHFEFK